jgi:RimJ/RimL family protein N-acetyltransferase
MRNLAQKGSTPAEIVIRKAEISDSAALRELRLEALSDSPQAFGADYEESQARTIEWWQEKIRIGDNRKQDVVMIAEFHSELIGMAGLFRPANSKSQHSGTIYGVYVKQIWRGKNIAQAMIHALLRWAQTNELRVVRLAVITTNISAINCYLSCGFKVYGVEPLSFH